MGAPLEADRGAAREAGSGRIVVVISTLDEEQSIADVVRSIPRHRGGRRQPRCERNKLIAARTRSPARAFEGAMINSASCAHRHNVICFVE